MTRFYVRLGLVIMLALVIASILVWTGFFEWMLTAGDWGTLTEPDLIGFLMTAFWIVTVGVLIVLFTLKRTLTRVEVDVQARDVELDERVRQMEQDIRIQMADAQEEIRDERKTLLQIAERAQRSDQAVLQHARAEASKRVAELRDQLGSEIHRLHEAAEARSRDAEAERMQAIAAGAHAIHLDGDVAERLQRTEDHQARMIQLLRDEARAVDQLRHDLSARVASVQDAQGIDREGIEGAVRAIDRLQVAIKETRHNLEHQVKAQHDELFGALDARMQELVTSGVNDKIREAIEVAFHPGRFYKVLGAAVGGGIVIVFLLALMGMEGPGWFTLPVAVFALGMSAFVLAAGVLVLIYSFTDTVRTLRGFAGQ